MTYDPDWQKKGLDPIPRKDFRLPPTPREAELMAEIERLRASLAEIKGIGTGPASPDVSPEGLRVACGVVAALALQEGEAE